MDGAQRRRLEDAYRRTTYRFGRIHLRVGESSAAMDRLLARRGHDQYAVLTAANPGSRILSTGENRERQAHLLTLLQERPLLLGVSVADAADWPPEPQVLVLGMAEGEAAELAKALGQNAFLVGLPGEPPALRFT